MDGCLDRRERILLFPQIFPQGKFPNNSLFCLWMIFRIRNEAKGNGVVKKFTKIYKNSGFFQNLEIACKKSSLC
jgi:hypothetical protein